MSTDRELLELAAKAIGGEYRGCYFYINGETDRYEWNPLEFDGDALRLAVKIGALVEINAPFGISYCHAQFTERMVVHHENENSPDGATRRAIVLCAAEIGKAVS